MKHWILHLNACEKWLSKAVAAVFKFTVLFYRVHLAGYFGGVCRFNPSCSVYAEQVLKQHPSFYGIKLVLKRLSRCHPFGPFGYDPVPSRESENCCAK